MNAVLFYFALSEFAFLQQTGKVLKPIFSVIKVLQKVTTAGTSRTFSTLEQSLPTCISLVYMIIFASLTHMTVGGGMNRSNLFHFIFICFIFFNLVFPGCTRQETQEAEQNVNAPAKGGVYRIPLRSNPSTLDPAYVQDRYGVSIVKQLFNGLVRFDPYLTILPALAETWQVEDAGKIYRFTLKKDARFHNSNPVTAEDVVFSIKRLLKTEPPPAVQPHLLKIVGAQEYNDGTQTDVSGLKIESDTTFTVHLEESHVPFLTALGMYQAAIVPKKEVLRLGEDFGKHPVGSGPFQFVTWKPDQTIQLKRFKTYCDGPAFLDEIHFQIYPGGQGPEILSDFQSGKLEEMAVYGDVKETLSEVQGLQWFHRPSLSLFFYGMNVNHPNLARLDLRKALSMAIDRTSLVKQVYNGQFEIARTILPPGMPGFNPSNKMVDNNPDLAKKIMTRSFGYTLKHVPELEIVSTIQSPLVEKEMDLIKSFWAEIGVSLRVKYITDWKKFEDYLRSDEVQIYRYAWFADMPDPDSFLHSLFDSESPTNFMQLRDKSVDKRLLNARGIVDPVERAKMYQKIEADVIASAPLIPLFYMSVDRVYQSYVKSANVSALGAHTMALDRVSLDKLP